MSAARRRSRGRRRRGRGGQSPPGEQRPPEKGRAQAGEQRKGAPSGRRRAGKGRKKGDGRRRKPAADIKPELLPIDEIGDRLEAVLASSPADETELVWLEVVRGVATRTGSRTDVRLVPERTVLVRVLDLGRVGSYRTGGAEHGDLTNAVRLAMAQSRVREPLSGLPHLPAGNDPIESANGLHDARIAALGSQAARDLLEQLQAKRETVSLEWAESRVVVYNSRGVRRQVSATGVGFEARCGQHPGSGRAANASRRLESLHPDGVLERARARNAHGDMAGPPSESVPVVLAPEAVISLIEMLNQESFSAKAYYDGTSFLREHLGVQVFDRSLTLVDDATDPSGIPFPFDLEGTAKRRVPLILDGAPKTPALDQRQAAVLGLPPTAHAIGGNDARAQNVFLVPGEAGEAELLRAAEGGLWIGWLDHLECREPNRVHFGARARGVRRIEGGELGPPLPDLFWEDSLLRAFSGILEIGSETATRLTRDGYLGGFTAPAVALAGIEGLRVR